MAVYTEVPDDQLIDFVASYDLGEVTAFKGIAEGVENSNFFLATDHGQFILTLYEKRVAPEDLPFFVGLVEHLAPLGPWIDPNLDLVRADACAGGIHLPRWGDVQVRA